MSEVQVSGEAALSSPKFVQNSQFADLYSHSASQVLGSGSYARVESFRRRADNKEVAIKIIQVYGSERCRQKVFKEIEIYSLCSGHPHIIDLIEHFEEDGMFYLVFPRMAGSLFETVVSRGRLTEMDAANVVRQIASGLAYLHSQGIAHRDIKPENILCSKQGHLDPVMICDFDLGSPVKLVREGRSTTPTLLTPVGSAEFMAPEVVDAWLTDQASAYDKKCDVWSLGVFAYVLCCGYPPFNGSCGKLCGWQTDEGSHCQECQMDLFANIQSGIINFPDQEWSIVSDQGKKFVKALLVKDATVRPSAVELLNNAWLLSATKPDSEKKKEGGRLLLTPSNLRLSFKSQLSLMIERSNDAYRRQSLVRHDQSIQQNLSPIAGATKFCLGSDDEDSGDEENHTSSDLILLSTTPRAGSGNLMAICTAGIKRAHPHLNADGSASKSDFPSPSE